MTRFDNIVIGAGTAGCVVAARLSEDAARSVLLLEAGGSDRRLEIVVPAAFIQQFGTTVDWDYWTEPEPTLDGRSIRSPRGKTLGGTSSMNAMAYIRGSRLDYDDWAAGGAEGWSYEEVLPYFRRSEDNRDLNDHFHGRGGPLTVARARYIDPVTEALLEGAVSLGLPRNDDFNGASHEGVGRIQLTYRDGRRLNAASAFLRPAMRRPNLAVQARALVTRIVVAGGRTVAVEYVRDGRTQRAEVDGDVVLCGGAFNTPALLQHSGIGPADHLASVGVRPLVDLPAVGRHLMEHPLVSVPFELAGGAVGLGDAENPRHLARWLLQRRGKLSSNLVEATCHWRSDASCPAPNFQMIFAPGHVVDHGAEVWPVPTYTIAPSYLAPQSRGEVLIASDDPSRKATVRYNMLATEKEVDEVVDAVLLAQEIAASEPMRGLTGAPAGVLSGTRDRAALRAGIRQTCQHTYHPSCSARIGTPEDGAVDSELRVHGIEGLRVADTSVMPTITRGNTQAPAYMIGEKAADLVRGRRAPDPRTAGVEPALVLAHA
ncbi:putative GMC-type oxidoreductase [Paraconexibacter sp. AEG42_29]|uniref:GMC-type oxidoreductase n=1 Tax=Paraconexibacter sp. AEG42_29 TaxID=2997339 RepID=A0AAU7AXU9_9ACTN